MHNLVLPKPFDGVEHGSFMWPSGDQAALLLHGFPGTPAEMKPLGKVLNHAGWTVHGMMLPGLGADIESLERRRFQDWTDAAIRAMDDLKRKHESVLLIGYSMGGALALHTATEKRPDGLVLLAPFWTLGGGWLTSLWPLIRLLFRRVRPLQHADFSAMDVRSGLQRMFANIDLDNIETQQALRQITLSSSTIEQVQQLGRSAFARASKIDVPTLVIQGSQDRVVPPKRTARLLNRFSGHVECIAVNSAHDLVNPACGGWTEVTAGLIRFADSIRRRSTDSHRRTL